MKNLIIVMLITSYLMPSLGYAGQILTDDDIVPDTIPAEDAAILQKYGNPVPQPTKTVIIRQVVKAEAEPTGGVVGLSVNGAVCQEKLSNAQERISILKKSGRVIAEDNEKLEAQMRDSNGGIPKAVWFVVGALAGGAAGYFLTRGH